MKTASPALIALLATRQFYAADLYEFTLSGGSTLRYTSGDKDIVWDAHTWSAGGSTGPYFDRSSNKAKCHWKLGVEVDTLAFDAMPGASTVQGAPFLTAVLQGAFDGAEFTLYRVFMATYGDTTAGAVTMFTGRVAEIDLSRSVATFNVTSHLELLNQNLPRNLYQAPCTNTLYDAGCTLNSAAFAVIGTALTGSTGSIINATIAQATGYFDMGKITFTSGANNGISRTIKSYAQGSPGTLSLISPLPTAPAASDTFTAYPGCDKTQATCTSKFSNRLNFRGFPYVPANEVAI